MKEYLKEFYTLDDIKSFENAFCVRIDLQYYSNRPVNKKVIDESKKNCKIFFIKTKNILSTIREEQIQSIRKKLVIKHK